MRPLRRPLRAYALPVLFVLLVLFLPSRALAAEIRPGTVANVPAGETINDDLYLSGSTIDVEGTVNGDVVAAGGTVTINGTVTGDVIVAGGTLILGGRVDRSVIAAGGTVVIDARVARNVVVGAGTVTIGTRSSIGRDVLMGAGSVLVNGHVARDVRVSRGTVEVGSTAIIGRDLTYGADTAPVIDRHAVIHGHVTKEPLAAMTSSSPVGSSLLIDWVHRLVGLFILGFLFVVLAGRTAHRAVTALVQSPWKSLLLGLGLLIVTPFVALIVFVLGVIIGGWWLAGIVLAVYVIGLVLGVPVSALQLGTWIAQRIGWANADLAWLLLAGLIVLLLLGLIPLIGPILLFIAGLLGFGALGLAVLTSRRSDSASLSTQTTP